jgi:NitT/TauT family transport system substrate-binding protein
MLRMLAILLLLAALGGASTAAAGAVRQAPGAVAPPGAGLDARAAPAVAAPQPAAADALGQVERVTVGDVAGSLASATIHVGRERGYFAEQGISLEMVPFDSGARMVPALVTGQIEVAAGSPSVGAYNAVARGLPFKIVADLVSSSPLGTPGYLMIRKDLADSGAIRDYADLRGRRLTTTAYGTSVHVIDGRALERGGLALSDAEIVEMGFGDVIAALGGRSVDVGFLPEPVATLAEDAGTAVRWHVVEDVVPGQVAAAVMFGTTLIDQRPDVARRFMLAYVRGCRDYYEGMIRRDPTMRAAVLRILTENSNFKDPALLERTGLHAVDPDGRVSFAALEADYRWYVAQGLMSDVIDLRQVIDNQFVDYAVQQLGPYQR